MVLCCPGVVVLCGRQPASVSGALSSWRAAAVRVEEWCSPLSMSDARVAAAGSGCGLPLCSVRLALWHRGGLQLLVACAREVRSFSGRYAVSLPPLTV